jgi:hypothetical protein
MHAGLTWLLSPTLEPRPKRLEYDKHDWFDKQQIKRTSVHFSCQEREKKEETQTIDYWQQSNHYLSTRATSCGRGYDYASSETIDDQIWPLEIITRASLMAQNHPFIVEENKKLKKHLTKRWEIKSKTTITIHSIRSLDL